MVGRLDLQASVVRVGDAELTRGPDGLVHGFVRFLGDAQRLRGEVGALEQRPGLRLVPRSRQIDQLRVRPAGAALSFFMDGLEMVAGRAAVRKHLHDLDLARGHVGALGWG